MNKRSKKIILFLGDIAVLCGALALTLYTRYGAQNFEMRWQTHLSRFILIFLAFLFSLYINQLYDLNIRATSRRFWRQTINTVLSAGLISIIYFYLSISSEISPKTNLAIFLGFFVILFYLWRVIVQSASRQLTKEGLAIIGNGQKGQKLKEALAKNPGSDYEFKLEVLDEAHFPDLAKEVLAGRIKTIVLCDNINPATTGHFLLSLLPEQVSVLSYPDFYEIITAKIPVEAIGTEWFLENLKESRRRYFQVIKRALDLSVALLMLIVSSPAWPIIALFIKLGSSGPVFFKQARLGQRGAKFMILKFRTMQVENNDQSLTTEGDSRITAFGKFLRKTRLDELPQTINIIKGEMSFIGPRPERPELAEKLEESIPFYNTRLIVKPGLSGWDQVSGEYHSPTKDDTLKKLQNDLFYIKNRSLFLDSIIILKTIATVFGRGGR